MNGLLVRGSPRRELFAHVTVNLPLSLMQQLINLIEERKFTDRTEAIISLLQAGIFMLKHQKDMDKKETQDKINELIHKEKFLDWLHTIPDSQFQGMQLAMLEEEKSRHKQASLF